MGSPLNRAVQWMEFVGKHGNASHLRSAAHELNYIQYNLIDVHVAIIISAIVSVLFICTCFKVICSLCSVHRVEKVKSKEE